MPKDMKENSGPVFPGPSAPNDGYTGKAQWEEPLMGPAGSTVGKPGKLTNQDAMNPTLRNLPHPAVLSGSDFPGKGSFTKSTQRNVDTGGVV